MSKSLDFADIDMMSTISAQSAETSTEGFTVSGAFSPSPLSMLSLGGEPYAEYVSTGSSSHTGLSESHFKLDGCFIIKMSRESLSVEVSAGNYTASGKFDGLDTTSLGGAVLLTSGEEFSLEGDHINLRVNNGAVEFHGNTLQIMSTESEHFNVTGDVNGGYVSYRGNETGHFLAISLEIQPGTTLKHSPFFDETAINNDVIYTVSSGSGVQVFTSLNHHLTLSLNVANASFTTHGTIHDEDDSMIGSAAGALGSAGVGMATLMVDLPVALSTQSTLPEADGFGPGLIFDLEAPANGVHDTSPLMGLPSLTE